MADPILFDTAAARADGISDAAIAEFLAPRIGFDLAAARKDGIPDTAIVDFLAPAATPEPEAKPARKAGLGDDINRGWQRAVESVQTLRADWSAQTLSAIEAAKRKADAGEYLTPWEKKQVANYDQVVAETRGEVAERLSSAAGRRQKAEDLPMSPGYKAFKEAEGIGGKLEALWKAPADVVTSIIAEGAVASAPSLGTAVLGGIGPGAVVAGGTAYLQTYAEKIIDLLAKRGVDIKDKDAVMAALSDPDVAKDIRTDATLAAIPQAAAAAASMAVAPITMAPARLATSPVRQQAVNIPAQAAAQGALAAAGETGSQAIIGEPLDTGRIAEAGISGAAQAPVDVAVFGARRAIEATRRPGPREIMAAETTDEAIDVAFEAVSRPEIEDIAVQAREFGGRADQDQAGLLQLFGGLNDGIVERAPDGTYQYRKEGDDKPIALKTWEPDAEVKGDQQTISPELAVAQRAHYEQLGVKVVYFENNNDIGFDGAVNPREPNTIYLSNNPERNAAQVGAHEFTHVLEATTLPDGTRLADLLHQQISEGLTGEGVDHAVQRFGVTAPERSRFASDEAHIDAVWGHLIREMGADIGGEAPKFQTFLPRIVEAVEQRYGLQAAKDVVAKLIEGIRASMRSLYQFFSGPEEGAEYGQPPAASQHWVANLDKIHDTLAAMYAERYGAQIESPRAEVAEPRVEEVPRPALGVLEVPPPEPPTGFFEQRPGPPPAPGYASAADRVARLEGWLEDLDDRRRKQASESPEAKALEERIDTILGKVKGVESRLTKVGVERLRAARDQLDRLTNPEGDSPDMALVRTQLDDERQRMADAAAVGTGPSPSMERAAAPEAAIPASAVPAAEVRGRAVMPGEVARPAVGVRRRPVPRSQRAEAVPETIPQPEAPVAPAPQPEPVETGPPKPVAEVAPAAAADQGDAEVRRAVTEGGLPERLAPEIARFYRPGDIFDVAFNRWLTVEEVKARRAVGDDHVVTPEILKVVGEADPVLKEAFGELEAHYTRNGNEIPDGSSPLREESPRAPETARGETAPQEAGRLEGPAAGGEPGSRGRLSDQAPEGDALKPAFSPRDDIGRQVVEARAETDTNPTEGQKEAGNYAKGRVDFHGLPFVMENPEGSTRRGVDANGKAWEAKLPADYGYFSRTKGADGDQVDAYIGKHHDSQRVWVVDQIDPKTGRFDEHKIMLGMRSVTEARTIYHRAFSDGTGPQRIGSITEMSLDRFKAWLEDGDTKSPVGKIEQTQVQKERAKLAEQREPAKPADKSEEGEKGQALFSPKVRDTEPRGPTLIETREATPEELASRQRAREREEAEARMRGRDTTGKPQEAADDLPLFGGDRQGTLFSPKVRTPEQERTFERVFSGAKPGFLEQLDAAREDWRRKVLRSTLDPFIGLKGEKFGDSYVDARIANSSAPAQAGFVELGTLKFKEEKAPDGSTRLDNAYDIKDRNGGVQFHLVRPLQNEAVDFLRWVAGHRAEKLMREGRENLMSVEDIKVLKALNRGDLDFDYTLLNGKTTRSREAAYLDSLKKYHEFNKNVIDLDVTSGLISRKFGEELKADPYYVPFLRVPDEAGRDFVGPSLSSGLVKQQAFRKLTGGTEKLNADLWQNALTSWNHQIDAAMRNKVAVSITDTLVKMGAGRELTAQEALHKSDKELKAQTVWVMRDGEKRYIAIEDPMILKAVSALEGSQSYGALQPVMDVGKWFARTLRAGVTANPWFAARMLIRDTENVLAIAPVSYNPIKNLADGFAQHDMQGALRNVARAIAGRDLEAMHLSDEAASAFVGGGLMRLGSGREEGIRSTTAANMLDSPDKVRAFWRRFTDGARAYKEVTAVTEDVNRLAVYTQAREQGASHKMASFLARDVQDFTLKGAAQWVRVLTDLTPFLNARAQGLYKLGRVAADSDKSVTAAVGGRVAKSLAMRAVAVVGAMALADLALGAIYSEDPDWKKRTEDDINMNWWFKIGDTQFRIPKGFEMAALSRLLSSGVEVFFDEEMTGERWTKNLWNLLHQNLQVQLPAAIQPLDDIRTNTTALGRPMVGRGLDRLLPEERYTANTSLLSRWAAAGINAVGRSLSLGAPAVPIEIDYLVNGYGGWAAASVLATADKIVRQFSSEPGRPDRDTVAWLTQGMVRNDPNPASRYVDMLYKQGVVVEQAYATYRDLVQRGRVAEAREFFEDNRDLIKKHGVVGATMRLEGDLNRSIRLIENHPDMSGEKKRLMIQQLQARKNQAAQAAMR